MNQRIHGPVNHNLNQGGSHRNRKNCIYIKNIPKSFNQNDKLGVFFRSHGQVKEIKTN